MKPVLLAFYDNGPVGLSSFDSKFEVVRLFDSKDPDSLIEKHANNVVAISCTIENVISADLMKRLPKLEIVATFSVGYDHIDLDVAAKQGVKVTNTPDVLCAETADTGMALLLNLPKRIAEADRFVRDGRWENDEVFPLGVSLEGKKIGIVGLGGIGAKVAKRCEAFDMQVMYYGPRKKDVAYPYFDNVHDLAAEVDFLMLTCPGGEATKHLINGEVLMALGQRGMLINIARGSVVDERALVRALRDGTIAGAGLDVFADEPHVPEELIPMDNVVLLPHIGSATIETRIKMGQLVIDNVLAHFDGKILLTPVF
jgi:lactate dehydrogenase-like 2-hydroxyacid dehydrogenase